MHKVSKNLVTWGYHLCNKSMHVLLASKFGYCPYLNIMTFCLLAQHYLFLVMTFAYMCKRYITLLSTNFRFLCKMWFDHFMDVDNSSSKIVMWIAVNGIRIPIPITEKANFANKKRRKSRAYILWTLVELQNHFASS